MGDYGVSTDVMTLSEVAEYLKLSEKTVLRMANKGEIPCAKVASQWRFFKPMIDDFLMSRMKVYPQNDMSRLMMAEHEFFTLSRLINHNSVLFNIKPGSKEEVLRQLIQPLVQEHIVQHEEVFLRKLMERENMVSTAIGHGIAIPHIRNPEENAAGRLMFIVGICPQGTSFDSPDGHLTELFFLMYTDSTVIHLRMLRKLSEILSKAEIVDEIVSATSVNAVLTTILREEQKISFKEIQR